MKIYLKVNKIFANKTLDPNKVIKGLLMFLTNWHSEQFKNSLIEQMSNKVLHNPSKSALLESRKSVLNTEK